MTAYPRSTDRPLWLHLGRLDEVLALAKSRPLRGLYTACLRAGWEAEDLEQELVLRLLEKQGEGSTYDPGRGGVGTYLHRVALGLLVHLLEERRTLKATRITVGATTTRDGEVVTVDAAEIAVADWVEPCTSRPEGEPEGRGGPRRRTRGPTARGGRGRRRRGGECA